MKNNAFEILGIANKELPVSNLLAYYFNPENGLGLEFLNRFCNVVDIPEVPKNKMISVEREHYILSDGKKNSIDILIRVGEPNNPDRIICIENKVYSTEGSEQTKRYVAALNQEYPTCTYRQYIYLSKDNSSVDLSSHSFIHVRYYELEPLFDDGRYRELPLLEDFYDYYVARDRSRFESPEENKLPVNRDNYNELIDYIVYKLNRLEENGKHPYYCARGKSAKSSDLFYQVSKHNWNFEYDKMPLTFHLESSNGSIALHFETNPYIPFSKLGDKRTTVEKLRKALRTHFEEVKMDEIENLKLRTTADLSIAKFHIPGSTFGEYISNLCKLIAGVDREINKMLELFSIHF